MGYRAHSSSNDDNELKTINLELSISKGRPLLRATFGQMSLKM